MTQFFLLADFTDAAHFINSKNDFHLQNLLEYYFNFKLTDCKPFAEADKTTSWVLSSF